MKIKNLLIITTCLGLMGGGCVSTQKYNDMVKARDHYRAQFETCQTLETEKAALEQKLRVSNSQLQKLNDILAQEKLEKDKIAEAKELLAEQYQETSAENAKLLTEYSRNKSTMEEQLATASDELQLRDRQLSNLEETVGVQTYDLQNRDQRVAELEKMLAEKDAQMARMRLSLSSALQGFSDSELVVSERDGKIYVTMSQELLFAKGSAEVDANGKKALEKLSRALVENPNIDVMVEGHTDDSGAVEYNLDLSIQRATSVAKLLAYNGVLPYRITPAGKGMHHPIVSNATEAGKARNRRVEVILSPNPDKMTGMSK